MLPCHEGYANLFPDGMREAQDQRKTGGYRKDETDCGVMSSPWHQAEGHLERRPCVTPSLTPGGTQNPCAQESTLQTQILGNPTSGIY